MILLPGVTKCPSCDQLVYPTDELFVVKTWPGVSEIPDCRPGIYHAACFRAARFCNAYLAHHELWVRQSLKERSTDWPILDMNEDFALVIKPRIQEYTLSFFKYGQEVSLAGRSALEQMADLLAQPERWLRMSDHRARFQVLYEPRGWTLAFREAFLLEFDFSLADFERILSYLQKSAAQLEGVRVDLDRICSQLQIVPLVVPCPLNQARGIFKNAEVLNALGKVVVTLEMEKWKKVALSFDEFNKFKVFMKQALLKGSG